jgi:hypothetical protein
MCQAIKGLVGGKGLEGRKEARHQKLHAVGKAGWVQLWGQTLIRVGRRGPTGSDVFFAGAGIGSSEWARAWFRSTSATFCSDLDRPHVTHRSVAVQAI